MKGKRAILSRDRRGVPERDRGIGAVEEPDLGEGHPRQALRRPVEEHPGEMRRPERLAPRPVGGERHQRAVGVADVRTRRPVLLVGRIERVGHEAVRPRLDAADAVGHRAVEPHRRPQRAAGNLEPADQRHGDGARPAALEAAPAVVDGLAERDGDRPERQRLAVDLDRLADARLGEELVGDAANRRRRHVADRRRPFRRVAAPCARRAWLNAVFAGERSALEHFAVRTDLDRVAMKLPSSAGSASGVSWGTALCAFDVPHSGLRLAGSRR